jgi:hypothetical protein
MFLTNEIMYNAIVLLHVSKKGDKMLKDLNNVLKSKDNLTVSQLLNMSVRDFMKTNANEVMGTEQV